MGCYSSTPSGGKTPNGSLEKREGAPAGKDVKYTSSNS